MVQGRGVQGAQEMAQDRGAPGSQGPLALGSPLQAEAGGRQPYQSGPGSFRSGSSLRWQHKSV